MFGGICNFRSRGGGFYFCLKYFLGFKVLATQGRFILSIQSAIIKFLPVTSYTFFKEAPSSFCVSEKSRELQVLLWGLGSEGSKWSFL